MSACKFLLVRYYKNGTCYQSDGLILKFCKTVETLYGKDAITPNMHLLNHLKEVIPDHGPVTSFWCLSFERFNGIPFYGAVQQHKIRRTPKHEKIHTDKIPKGYETNKRVPRRVS